MPRVLTLLLAALVALPAAAQGDPPTEAPGTVETPPMSVTVDEGGAGVVEDVPAEPVDPEAGQVLVSLRVQERPIREVLDALGQQVLLRVSLDDRAAEEPVSLAVERQPVDRVLALICQAADLVAVRRGDGLLVTFPAERRVTLRELGEVPVGALRVSPTLLDRRVTVGFVNLPLRDALATLSDQTGATLLAAPSVPADLRITASFHEAPLTRCLYMLCLTGGLYVEPSAADTLFLVAPDRVAAGRPGEDAKTLEFYPDDYRGALGYLVTDTLWTRPDAFGVEWVRAADGEPRVRFSAPVAPVAQEPGRAGLPPVAGRPF